MNLKKTVLLLVVLLSFACTKKNAPLSDPGSATTEITNPDSALQVTASKINDLGFDIFQLIQIQSPNVLISPISIYSALSMVYAGAGNKTASQIKNVLHINKDEVIFPLLFTLNHQLTGSAGEAVDLKIANALWIQDKYPFSDEYFVTIKKYFKAGSLNNTDFINRSEQARKEINNWVGRQTGDKIKNLVIEGALSTATRLVLVNAVYFSGNWEDEFNPKKNTKSTFTNEDGSEKETTFMNMKNKSFLYFENKNYQLCGIPYKNSGFSLFILLPRIQSGMNYVLSVIKSDTLLHRLNEMTYYPLNLSLPKFKIDSRFELSKPMIKLGMEDAFSNNADFSRMTNKKSLKINLVPHQSFIEVNEKGTRATAATAVLMKETTAFRIEKPRDFVVNRPFLLIIRENRSQTILFLGKLGKI